MTEKKRQVEAPLSKTHFQALIENAHDGIVIYDPTGKITYASHSVKKVCGYAPHEVVGKSGAWFIHPDDVSKARTSFVKLIEKPRKSIALLLRIKYKNRSYIWSETILTNFSHIPEIKGIVSNFRDITEKKLAEEKEFKTQRLLETLSRNLSEGMFMGILGSNFLYVNDAFLKLSGYTTANEVLKMKVDSFYADAKQAHHIRRNLKKSISIKGVETVLRKRNGDKFIGLLNLSLLKKEGKDDHFVGTVRDITREKNAEREKIESRNFLDNIINTVAAPFFVKDSKHRWVMVNEQFSKLIGRPKEELIGQSDKKFWSADEAQVFLKIDRDVLRTGKIILNEEKVTSRDGVVHDLLTIKSRYTNEDGKKFIIGFITEITQIRQAEGRIKQLHASLEAVMESAKDSIFSVDQKLNYTAFNQHHKYIMKLLYGANIKVGSNKIKYLQHTGDSEWVKAELLKALKGQHYYSEHVIDYPGYKGYIQTTYNPIKDEKNKIKGVAVFVQDITQRKQFEDIVKSVNSNLKAVMESTADRILALDRNYRYITFNKSHAESVRKQFGKNIKAGDNVLEILPRQLSEIAAKENAVAFQGKRFKSETQLPNKTILETSYNPIYNDKGQVTGSALFIRDITESKKIEEKLKSLNEELIQQNLQLAAQEDELKNALNALSERNFELDQLMYKTSHDLRAPLCSILGLLNLANIDVEPANHQLYLDKIKDRINKLDDFISSMLNYARVNRAELETIPVNLEGLAKNSLKELEYLENYAKVKVTLQNTTPDIIYKTDKLRISIIFSNIISNAFKYYNPTISDSFLKIKIAVTPKEAQVEFSDNGIGIKEEHINKIFNMFYRATERSQGSGLGMYIVKQAVEKLRGTISVESKYGAGTKIKIKIPTIDKVKTQTV